MKPVRRRVLIREYDYKKMISNSTGSVIDRGVTLYNRSEFIPVTREEIEKEAMWNTLSNKPVRWLYRNHDKQIFDGMHDYLYNIKYTKWKSFWDPDGYLCVQSRSNTPVSRIGWGIFEYDIQIISEYDLDS